MLSVVAEAEAGRGDAGDRRGLLLRATAAATLPSPSASYRMPHQRQTCQRKREIF